jgi:hypothetical protein
MILGCILFVPAALIGWSLVRILTRQTAMPAWAGIALEIFLGFGVGTGLIATALLGLIAVHAAGRVALFSIEIAVAIIGIWFAVRTPAQSTDSAPTPRSPWIWPLRAAAALVLVFFAVDVSRTIDASPQGSFDAVADWSVKAKFLTAPMDGVWRNATSPLLGGGMGGAKHPGYPQLVPSAVASAWILEGDTASATGAASSLLFALAAAAVLFVAVAYLQGEAAGLIALMLLLASEGFVSQAGVQDADIPLAFYILATLVLLALAQDRAWPRELLILAGLCAGFAAWTKNEGLPFLVFALAAAAWSAQKKAVWMALGALPGVIVLAVFKLAVVLGSETTFATQFSDIWMKVTSVSRWMQIAGSFIQSIWQMGNSWTHPVLLAAILCFAVGFAPRAKIRRQIWLAVPIAGLLAADFGAYMLSINDLSWQITTSNIRLIVQVWPALLFVLFLMIASPALNATPREEPAKSGKSGRPRGKTRRASAGV